MSLKVLLLVWALRFKETMGPRRTNIMMKKKSILSVTSKTSMMMKMRTRKWKSKRRRKISVGLPMSRLRKMRIQGSLQQQQRRINLK